MWESKTTQKFGTENFVVKPDCDLDGKFKKFESKGHVTRTRKKESVEKFWLEIQKAKVKSFASPPFWLMVGYRCCFFH